MIGQMDREIVIESPSSSLNSLNEPIVTWGTFASVWAWVKPMTARERFASDALRASRVSNFRIRWLSGVLPTMRIRFDGEIYRILGLSEVGRRRFLDITAETFK